MATRRLLADLAALHEFRSGQAVALTAMGGVDAARMVRAGDPVDVVVLAKPVMAKLEAEGFLLPGSCVDLARSPTVVACGPARPPRSVERSRRRARDAAGRSRHRRSSTGPSGDHLIGLLTRWGILDTVAAKLVKAEPGVPVGSLLAQGAASLGLQQFSELMDLPGVEIIGPLPPGIDATTTFTAGVGTASPLPCPPAPPGVPMTHKMRDRYRRHGMGAAQCLKAPSRDARRPPPAPSRSSRTRRRMTAGGRRRRRSPGRPAAAWECGGPSAGRARRRRRRR